MQVSTGLVFGSLQEAYLAGVPAADAVEVYGTRDQVESLSRAVQHGRADDKRKAARRQAQRSRRANRSR